MEFLGIDEPNLLRIVREHLDDIAANHFRKVARALKVDEDEVRRLVEVLRVLNPRPAGAFSPGPSPGYIVPDVTLRRFDEDWLITSNNEALPTLRVSPRYRSMLKSGSTADDETRRYLKDKIRSAESFIKNVDRRKDTVTRITQIIMEVQAEFFEDGHGLLRPLRLEDVAVELGVHLSTVSRGVTGKYMATPYGLFELKHFFSGGYRTTTGHRRRRDEHQAATSRARARGERRQAALGPAARRAALRRGRHRRAAHGGQVPRGAAHRAELGQAPPMSPERAGLPQRPSAGRGRRRRRRGATAARERARQSSSSA